MRQLTDFDTQFGKWMVAHGYTCRTLGHELGYSENMIYRVASGSRGVGANLQIRFINRFGRAEAAKVFDDSPLLAVLETA